MESLEARALNFVREHLLNMFEHYNVPATDRWNIKNALVEEFRNIREQLFTEIEDKLRK